GLGDGRAGLSPHLRSRHEVGNILRDSGVPVVEFRASIVIGAGSVSFELVRCLVQRLPILIAPRWVSNHTQPIGTEDLLAYFLAALDLPEGESRIFEIGGRDVVPYGDILREYARQRGVRRWMLPVPSMSPRLSRLVLKLVAPRYARIGAMLIDSLRSPTIVRDRSAEEVFRVRPKGLRDAIARALEMEDDKFAHTRWFELFFMGKLIRRWGGVLMGSRIVDFRSVRVGLPADEAFKPIARIGGENGWYYWDWLWRIRGLFDEMLGGAGMRRGRKGGERIAAGDVIDCWRVEYFEPGRELLLASELKLPGRAWLQFEVSGDGASSVICQSAIYDPAAPWGFFLWYLLYPFHKIIFTGMIREIAKEAEKRA
ncbi:MAG: DUF2867 domain-containing protein, partial [Elusimicrobia bacterium]|nr:DUF2867 domain-containing protein [Elusimicrobiota bacterium]